MSMYADNELLFPPYVIPTLRLLRGDQWRDLVDHVAGLPQDHPESLAFSLMMVRLDGCMGCETDSFRAMRGCMACAQQVLRRHKGSEAELLKRYRKALQDVRAYLEARPGERAETIPLKAKAA
jgi:hypothetical protein